MIKYGTKYKIFVRFSSCKSFKYYRVIWDLILKNFYDKYLSETNENKKLIII